MNKAIRLEDLLAALLRYGSAAASAVVGLGYVLALFGFPSRLARAGIVMFILLPILRVLTMCLAWLRDRDYRYALIAALVLAIILLGIFLGIPA
jgi:hypothetical protein